MRSWRLKDVIEQSYTETSEDSDLATFINDV